MKFTTVMDVNVFPPQKLSPSTVLRIHNDTSTDLTGIGLFLRPASVVGDVDDKPEANPFTDLMDLLRWGQRTLETVTPSGGLKVTRDTNSVGAVTDYFGFFQGSSVANKLPLIDIPAGSYADITIEIETPPATSGRRFYVELEVE